jgi:hypothetical protein
MAEHAQPERRSAQREAAALDPRTGPLGRPHVPTLGQRQAEFRDSVAVARPNRTGLPDRLKTGIESLSGLSMDDVRAHYGSSKPAHLGALAYAQGNEIHVAPGAERHLPHEAWHVVQQKQGRVKATRQMKAGIGLSDDPGLEGEADIMGARASSARMDPLVAAKARPSPSPVVQLKPTIADPDGKLVDVATAAADEVAAVLDGFWDSGKKAKITDAVSVAAVQRPDVMNAVSEDVADDMIRRVVAKTKLLVEVVSDLWKQGSQAVKGLPVDLATAAVADESARAQLKAIGGHRLINAVEKAKIGKTKAKELPKAAAEFAQENIEDLTFESALTDEFRKKHVAEPKETAEGLETKTMAEAAEEAHGLREKARVERVAKTKEKTAKAARRADRAVSTRFLFPANEQVLIVDEIKALNQRILEQREANPRALYRLTKNHYSFVSVYKERGQETGKARFWYTVIGTPGDYQINHLDALVSD